MIDFQTISGDLVRQGFKFSLASPGYMGAIATAIVPYFLTFAGIGLAVYFLFGGWTIMTAGDNSKKTEEGQHIITNAIMGFLMVFGAYFIIQLLAVILNLDAIKDIFT